MDLVPATRFQRPSNWCNISCLFNNESGYKRDYNPLIDFMATICLITHLQIKLSILLQVIIKFLPVADAVKCYCKAYQFNKLAEANEVSLLLGTGKQARLVLINKVCTPKLMRNNFVVAKNPHTTLIFFK